MVTDASEPDPSPLEARAAELQTSAASHSLSARDAAMVSASEYAVNDTVSVGPDGSIGPLSCTSTHGAVAVTSHWQTATSTCYVMGGANGQKTYTWSVDGALSGTMCANGQGWNNGAYWGYAGCGSSGWGTVAWKNSAAVKPQDVV